MQLNPNKKIDDYIGKTKGARDLIHYFEPNLDNYTTAQINNSIKTLREGYKLTRNYTWVDADNDFEMQDVEEEASINAAPAPASASMHQQPPTPKTFDVRTPMRGTPRSMPRGYTPSFGRRGNTPSFGRGGHPESLRFDDLSLSDETGTNGGRSVYTHMNQDIQRVKVILTEKNAKKIIDDLDLDTAILNYVKKDNDNLDRTLKDEMKSTNNVLKTVLEDSTKLSTATVSKSCLFSHQIALAAV